MTRRYSLLLLILALATTSAWAQDNRPQQPPSQTFTLSQALEYAQEHYPSVRVAMEQVHVSTTNVTVAKTAYLPRLDTRVLQARQSLTIAQARLGQMLEERSHTVAQSS